MAIFRKKQKETGLPGALPQTGQMLDEQAQMPHGLTFELRDADEEQPSAITVDHIREAMQTLRKYRAGKANLERRLIENEEWWKLHHWEYIPERGTTPLKTKSSWLVNVILSKHADAMDAVPEPNCLPQEETDQMMAEMLSDVLPVILRQSDFEKTWSDNWWKKLKAGVAIYGVFWDDSLHNGLGDIAFRQIDPLNLFWEPGVTDLQKSRNIFHVELQDNEALIERYPQLEGKLGAKTWTGSRYRYDDNVDTSDKSPVVDWYYRKSDGQRTVLHYVKFVGEEILYATENDVVSPMEYVPYPEAGMTQQSLKEPPAVRGLYDHGMYPFFADPLFPEEGTPAGYGYIDICKDAQRQIDLMNNAIIANCIAAATPRWLKRGDDGVNEAEYSDWTKPFVHVQGSIEEAAMRQITVAPLSGNYLSILESKINELKETTGNRDVNNGGSAAGVTAASAIAAMQEQSGKLSRDQIQNSYRCFREICYCAIELIRQFYDAPRTFRVTGPKGMMFLKFDASMMQGAPMGVDAHGQDLGIKTPKYDIEVSAQKQSPYNKMAYNELALQLYGQGFFNPQLTDQALAALKMMDFKGKDDVVQTIESNGTLYQQLQLAIQTIQQLTAAYRGGAVPAAGAEPAAAPAPSRGEPAKLTEADELGAPKQSNTIVEKAKAQAAASTQPR